MRCEHCGAPLPPPAGTGRPKTYCTDACRRDRARDMAELGRAVTVVAKHDLMVMRRKLAPSEGSRS